jgi:hypothetical protein
MGLLQLPLPDHELTPFPTLSKVLTSFPHSAHPRNVAREARRRRAPAVLQVVLAAGWSDPPGPFRTSPRPGIFADGFPQQIVFQHELPFAGNECSTAQTACCFKIDGLRPRFGSDDLVKSISVRAAEKLRCIRVRHDLSWRPVGGAIVAPFRQVSSVRQEDDRSHQTDGTYRLETDPFLSR